jgi:hypothetical protein
MIDQEQVRSVRRVGLYHVAWLHGVPEAVEEAITDFLLRHPHMIPPERLIVAWDYWPADHGPHLFRSCRADSEVECRVFSIKEDWWARSPLERECAFVADMMTERLIEAGKLRPTADGMELDWGDGLLKNAEAAAVLYDWVDEILAETCPAC